MLIGVSWWAVLVILAGIILRPSFKQKIMGDGVTAKNVNIFATVLFVIGFILAMWSKTGEGLTRQTTEETITDTTTEPAKVDSSVVEQKVEQPKEAPKPEPTVAKKEEPKPTKPQPKEDNNVESTSKEMDFRACVALQQQTADFLTGHKIIHVVNTNILSIVKYCMPDGVILITCSEPDRKMVTTKSDNMTGCK